MNWSVFLNFIILSSTSMLTHKVGLLLIQKRMLIGLLFFIKRNKKKKNENQYWCKPNRLKYRNQNWDIVPVNKELCFLKTEKKKSLKEEEEGSTRRLQFISTVQKIIIAYPETTQLKGDRWIRVVH